MGTCVDHNGLVCKCFAVNAIELVADKPVVMNHCVFVTWLAGKSGLAEDG